MNREQRSLRAVEADSAALRQIGTTRAIRLSQKTVSNTEFSSGRHVVHHRHCAAGCATFSDAVNVHFEYRQELYDVKAMFVITIHGSPQKEQSISVIASEVKPSRRDCFVAPFLAMTCSFECLHVLSEAIHEEQQILDATVDIKISRISLLM